ncbi:hypothetical protein ACN6MT_07145 [Neobacillus niacini]
MHTRRLAGFGITDVNAKNLAINPKLSDSTKAPGLK